MAETETDDVQLRATEAQMRHALGLDGNRTSAPPPNHSVSLPTGLHPQKRRFVRDGEVPVTIIHRDHNPDGEQRVNQLDAARQALRAETTARERAERSLEEAQTIIHDLQTKLAHERLAKDEAVQSAQRLTSEARTNQQSLHTTQAELAEERQARQKAEYALSDALRRCHVAEKQLRKNPTATAEDGPNRIAGIAKQSTINGSDGDASDAIAGKAKPGRRRGRPSRVAEDDTNVVEWWVPGWQEKFR